MTTPVPALGPTSTTATTGTTATASPANQLGKDTFLKLLVAQLKYQDPSKPADSSQFMAQSAQFSMVEKLEEIARQTAEALQSQRLTASAAYLGRTVTTTGEDGKDVTGVVTAVRLDPSGPVLRVGNRDIPLTAVTQVSDGGTTRSTTS